jgi:hypothetical protein
MRQRLDVELQELSGLTNHGISSNLGVNEGRTVVDIVIFGGKTQVSGTYFNPLTIPSREEDLIGVSQVSPLNIILFAVHLKLKFV